MSLTFPKSGDTFVDKYTIDLILNQGGFGRVYKATQHELNRPVAIKILQPARRIGFNDDSKAEARRLEIVAKRFEREAQLVSQLRDPHTVMMFDYGTTPEGLLYMVLEFVDGLPLDRMLEEESPLSVERVVKITQQILSSLQEAHAMGMLHRDIKPANIMLYEHVGRRDQVKVLDFGLAKSIDDPQFSADDPDLTDAEVLIGTPRYMSPEQIRGDKMSAATDMYSLGLVVYEMLTGHKAVRAKSTMNTLARHINDVPFTLPIELAIDRDLRDIVQLMLEKDLNYRTKSAEQVMAMLDAWTDKRKSGSFPGLEAIDISGEFLPEILEFSEVEESFAEIDEDSLEFLDDFVVPDHQAQKKQLAIAGVIALIALILGGIVFFSSGPDESDQLGIGEASPVQAEQPPKLDPKTRIAGKSAINEAGAQIGAGIDAGTESLNDMKAPESFEFAETESDMAIATDAEPREKKKRKKRKKRKKKPALRTLQ